MTTAQIVSNPVEVIESLDVDAIADELERIRQRQSALMVLMRTARRNGKRSQRSMQRDSSGRVAGSAH